MAQGPAQQLPNLHPGRLTSSFATLERDLSLLSHNWAFLLPHSRFLPIFFSFTALPTRYTAFFPSCLLYLLLPRLLCWEKLHHQRNILIDLNSKYSEFCPQGTDCRRMGTLRGHVSLCAHPILPDLPKGVVWLLPRRGHKAAVADVALKDPWWISPDVSFSSGWHSECLEDEAQREEWLSIGY